MILKIVILVLATISTLLLIIGLIRGKQFAGLVENLNDDEYPLKDFYVIGFFLNTTKLFHLRGKLEVDLKQSAKLVWDNIYAEYYANLTWAQFLTFALLEASAVLVFCGFLNGPAMLLFLGFLALLIMATWNLTMSKMKEAVNVRREECEAEFPNMVSKLTLLINSGMVLRDAWRVIAEGKDGPLYDLMKKACIWMDNGDSDQAAIHKFGVLSDSNDIKKFTGAIIQGMEKGSGELTDILAAQASELWAHKRQRALQQGEIAAGKLVIPLGIMFAGIIMIIVSAAMQSMSF